MASTAVLVPIEEYLTTDYSPDVDYVDGELQERNMGEGEHSTVQKFFIAFFAAREEDWHILTYPEQRVQTTPTRYRVPDVCVMKEDAPFEPIIRIAPLLCIEVLSPEDRMARVQKKVAEYIHMGVRAVWIVDPWERQVTIADGSITLQPAGEELTVRGTPIRLRVADIFRQLDKLQARMRQAK